MDIEIGGKTYSFDALGAAALANHFPDIMFFAGGKCVVPRGKVKIRISLSLAGHRLKRWSDTVEYFEVEGTPVGNMFDGYLLKKDEVEAGVNVKCEISDGSGYEEATAAQSNILQIGSLQVFGVEFVSKAGNIATSGFAVTI